MDRNVKRNKLDKSSGPSSRGNTMNIDIPAPRHMQQAASLVLYGVATNDNDALKCFIQLAPVNSTLLAKLRR